MCDTWFLFHQSVLAQKLFFCCCFFTQDKCFGARKKRIICKMCQDSQIIVKLKKKKIVFENWKKKSLNKNERNVSEKMLHASWEGTKFIGALLFTTSSNFFLLLSISALFWKDRLHFCYISRYACKWHCMQTVKFRLNNVAPWRGLLGFWVGARGVNAKESSVLRIIWSSLL